MSYPYIIRVIILFNGIETIIGAHTLVSNEFAAATRPNGVDKQRTRYGWVDRKQGKNTYDCVHAMVMANDRQMKPAAAAHCSLY